MDANKHSSAIQCGGSHFWLLYNRIGESLEWLESYSFYQFTDDDTVFYNRDESDQDKDDNCSESQEEVSYEYYN